VGVNEEEQEWKEQSSGRKRRKVVEMSEEDARVRDLNRHGKDMDPYHLHDVITTNFHLPMAISNVSEEMLGPKSPNTHIEIWDRYGFWKYVWVDPIDYVEALQYKWSKGRGYPMTNINGRPNTMHDWIWKRAHPGMKKPVNMVIDHEYSDVLDCRRDHLRLVSYSVNSHSRNKRSGCTSTYYNVKKCKNGWAASCGGIDVVFKTEASAAYHADQLCMLKYGNHARLNNVTEPEHYEDDFVKPLLRRPAPLANIHHMVTSTGEDRWRVQITTHRGKINKTFETLEDAQKHRDQLKEEHRVFLQHQRAVAEIRRDENGVAFRTISRHPEMRSLVDDDTWLQFQHVPFILNNGRVNVYHEGKPRYLARIVMNALNLPRTHVVDHINSQHPLDNRRCNLRIVTVKQNNQNVVSRNASGYAGVAYTKSRRWHASLDRKRVGTYDTKELAAAAYDCRAREMGYLKFNNVSIPEGWQWDTGRCRLVQVQA
jgi:hypothetical protein